MAGYSTPYAFANYLGEWANDAAALVELRARKWDSTGDGLGLPLNGMTYYATGVHEFRSYIAGAWVSMLSVAMVTLDVAYNGGRLITADVGAVDISVPVAVNGTALALHQLMPAATADVFTIENLGAAGASIGLTGTRRWIESDSANMRIQLTANDALAYALQIYAENLGVGGTAGIGIVADDDVSVTATAGQLVLHGYNGLGGAGVEIEATAGGGTIAIGSANLPNAIAIGVSGARTIQMGYSGTTSTSISGMDVGLLADTNDALAHAVTIRATNAGAGTAILNIDAKDAITIDSAAAGFSIDGVTDSNVCTTTGMMTLDATAGKVYVGTGAGGSSVSIGNLLRGMAVNADTYTLTATGLNGHLQIMLSANVAVLRDLQIDADNVNAAGARITFSDSWQKDSGAGGGYTVAMPFGTTAAEWTTFKTNFGDGTSLLNAINQCAASAVTLDEAYNASGGPSTIAVDAGDVTWNVGGGVSSLYSFVVDVSACLGVIDGFQILNGADFFKVLRTGAATLDLSAELGTFDINCFSALTLDSTTQTFTASGTWDVNAAGAITLDSSGGSIGIGVNADAFAIDIGTGAAARTITIGNTANTTEIEINAKVVDVNVLNTSTWSTGTFALDTTGICDIDSGGVLSLNSSAIINIGNDANAFGINIGTGAAQRNLIFGNVTGTTSLTVNVGTGGFQVNTTGTGTVDINGTNAVTIDAAAGFSLDGVGASNVTATSGNLTLSTLVTGGVLINSIGIADIDAVGAIQINSTSGAISVGNDANSNGLNLGTGGDRAIIIGNVTGATSVTTNTGTGGFVVNTTGVGIIDLNGAVGTWDATSLTLTTSLGFDVNSTGAVTLDAAGASAITIGGDANTGAAGFGTGGDRAVTVGSVTGTASLGIRTGTGGMVFTAGGIWDVNAVGAITLDSTAGTIGIGTGVDAFAVSLGTAGVRPVTVGSPTGASNTTIQAGTGVLNLSGLGFIDFSDGYKAAGGFASAFHLALSAAEWTTFETNYGEVSLLNALSQSMGLTTLNAATLAFNDFSIGSIHVLYTATGICTITIDTDQVARVNRTITIKDVGFNAATNNIIVETEGAETIEGQANLVINVDGCSITLQSNGTNWFIV